MQSWIFSIITHDPSEIILICWFGAPETFINIITNVEHSCAAYIFEESEIIIFNNNYLIKLKRTAYISNYLFNINNL